MAVPDTLGTLRGHAAVFNQWTTIDSWEGRFLERLAPGAFSRTLVEDRAALRVLFQHGADAMAGSKPLGPLTTVREDDYGLAYEVPLLDTSYNRDLVPGLKAGLYGASFRFAAQREEWVDHPGTSDYNPRGLAERTLREVALKELGPVTFGAYLGATAGVRSSGVFFASGLPISATDTASASARAVTFTRGAP